ncbi:MAG: hypothetical protein QOH74_1235 [Gaiellales bacterium]|jgi:hypothetical protein|nr:hypothetical protein [Gaiellales bacterium]
MQSLRPCAFITTLAVTAALVTGCGSSTQSSESTASAGTAVPAGALFYADVNLDRGSDAWKQFTAVGQRFPSWQRLTGKLMKKLDDNKSGTTFSTDIQPWLGARAAIALTGISADGPSYVVYAASTDDEAAKNAEKRDKTVTPDGEYKGYTQFREKRGYSAVGNGAVLLANDEATLHAAIDAREGNADSLADDPKFTASLDALPADSLARGWLNAPKVAQLTSLASLGGLGSGINGGQIQQVAKALDKIDSASFAVWATDGGYHTTFRATAKAGSDGGLLDGVTFSSSLSDLVPSDAFGYLAFKAGDKQLANGLGANPALNAFERQTGISIQNDVVPLFNGEGLFYAGPGVPFRGALMLDPSDPKAAKGALTRLVSSLARLNREIRVTDLPDGGQRVELAPGLALFWRQVPGGPLVLGNDEAAGSTPADGLLTSNAYKTFLQKAGVGNGTVSLYLDVPSALSFMPNLPPDARPVGGVAAWSSKSGNTASVDLFVEIKG